MNMAGSKPVSLEYANRKFGNRKSKIPARPKFQWNVGG